MRHVGRLSTVIVLMALLIGCGSDHTPTEPPPEPVTMYDSVLAAIDSTNLNGVGEDTVWFVGTWLNYDNNADEYDWLHFSLEYSDPVNFPTEWVLLDSGGDQWWAIRRGGLYTAGAEFAVRWTVWTDGRERGDTTFVADTAQVIFGSGGYDGPTQQTIHVSRHVGFAYLWAGVPARSRGYIGDRHHL